MARRRKNTDTEQTPRQKGNMLSDEALTALNEGTYGEKYGRKAQYRTSQEQTEQAKALPVLEGMGGVQSSPEWQSRFSKANQYQQNIANDAKRYQYDQRAAAANTLDDKDREYMKAVMSQKGEDAQRKMLESKYNKEGWAQKYNKTADEIYRDYVADQRNETIRQGKDSPILSSIYSVAADLGTPVLTLPSLVANAIAPDSEFAKKAEEHRANYSDKKKLLRAGVKENTGEKGDRVLDTVYQVADRMANAAAGKAMFGNLGTGIMTGLSDANQQMDELNLRPGISNRQKALSAAAHGTVEGAGTAITGGLLDGLPAVNGVLGRAVNIGKGAGNAAIENSISEAIENSLDTIINGENSKKELNKALYMSQGMSESQAEKKAKDDQWQQVKSAALTGAAFGGGMKGMSEAADVVAKALDNSQIPSLWLPGNKPVDTSDIDDVISKATDQAEGAKAEIDNLAKKIPEAPEEITPEVTPKVEKPKNYSIQEVNLKGGKKGYYVAESIDDTTTRNVEPGKVYRTEAEAQEALNRVQNPADNMPEKAAGNPTLTQDIENLRAEIEAKKAELETKYADYTKANKKNKKAAWSDYEAARNERKALEYRLRNLERQSNGLTDISQQAADNLDSLKNDIWTVGKMYAGKQGRNLAREAAEALDKLERSGTQADYRNFVAKVEALKAAATETYTNKKGVSSTYDTYFREADGGDLLKRIYPPQSADEVPSGFWDAFQEIIKRNEQHKGRSYKDLLPENPYYETKGFENLDTQGRTALRDKARAEQLKGYEFTKPVKATQTEYAGFDITKGSNSDIQDAIDSGKAYIAEMSPLEYLQRSAYDIEDTSALEGAISGANSIDRVSEYADAMRRGDKFPILSLTYEGKIGRSQEGRTRALAAYEAGIDKVPVAIIGEPSANPRNAIDAIKKTDTSGIPEEELDKALLNSMDDEALEMEFLNDDVINEVPNVKPTEAGPQPEIPNLNQVVADNAPIPPSGPETDISQRYETLKNSDLFQKSQANMQMLETAKKQGMFNKDIEGRAQAQQEAFDEYTSDPTRATERNLNRQWTSGKDLDTSMLVLHDALDSGSQAYTNLVMLKQAQQVKGAGRVLRAALDYAKKNYAGTKEGVLQEGAKFLNDKADALLKNRKTAEQFDAIAKRIMDGDLSDLNTRFNMDDVNIQNIKDALAEGAGREDIARMIAMYQSVGKTGISAEAMQKISDIYNQIQEQGLQPNSRARANLETDAFKVLAQDIGGKRTWKEQWDAWRYLAMLGNPKTHLRNILGNTTHYMVTEAKDNVGAALEAAIDKANKAAGGQGIDRTKAVLTGKDKTLVDLAAKDADDVSYAALNDSGNKYNVKNEIDRARNSFNNKTLAKVDELNSNLLDVEDYTALKRKYSKSLARFLKANGADDSIFNATDDASKALLDKGRAYAIDQAKQATFHEYSKAAEMLSRFSQDMSNSDKLRHKAGAYMLEGILPFKKTPINILKQGFKYSPVSIATGLKKAFDAVQNGNSTAAEAIEDMAAGLTGSGIMGLGMLLAHEGFLTGSANPDYEVDQAETEQGAQNYALKIGDKSYTLDWLAPLSMPLFVGAELSKLLDETDDTDEAKFDKIISAFTAIAEPVTEMSMLQGINNTLEELSNSKVGALGTLAASTALGYITQGVPTVAGQVARAIDDTRRSTYSDKTGVEKMLDKTITKVENKLPFVSMASQPYVGANGQEQKNEGLASYMLGDNFGTRLIDQMLSPGYFKEGSVSPVDEELNRLYNATGTDVYKNVLSGKVNNEKLGKESFTSYQKLYGSNTDYLYNDLVNSKEYQSLDDAERVKALKNAKDISKMIADHEVGGKALEKSEQKIYDIYRSKGQEGIAQYLKDKTTASSLGMDYDTYQKKNEEVPGGAAQWVQDKQSAIDTGFIKKDGTADVESYENAVKMFGNNVPAIQSYSDYKKQGFTKNAEKVPYLIENDAFTDEQKGLILMGSKTYDDLGKAAQGAYDLEGSAGVYYFYLLKQLADTDGNGSVKKAEKEALLNSDNPYVTGLSDDMYYYLAGAKW